MEIYYEYGSTIGSYTGQTAAVLASANTPTETVIGRLAPNTRYYYRSRYREPGEGPFVAGPENTFVTQRAPGSPSRLIFRAIRIPNGSANSSTRRFTHAPCSKSHPTSLISI